jgi:FKBP-type peptidyl-prolyl cis-trans isomerase SlyD
MKTRDMMVSVIFAGFIAGLSIFSIPSEGVENAKKEAAVVVAEGKSVKVHYTLKVGGKVVGSSIGREPIQFKAGSHQIIPGFEKAIIGMKAGQKKSFKLSPEQGYGLEDPKAIKSIPKTQIPPDIKPKAGMILDTQGKDGQRVPVKVVEVKKDVVVIDFNHPLAGKTLYYDVEVVEVK